MGNDSDVKVLGIDAQEMQEWIESFDAILKAEGRDSASLLLDRLRARAQSLGVGHAFTANTPYVNTISADKQAVFPGARNSLKGTPSTFRGMPHPAFIHAPFSKAVFPRRCLRTSAGSSERAAG